MHLAAGTFYWLVTSGAPALAVYCSCQQSPRIGKSGQVICTRCNITYTSPADVASLPIRNSRKLIEELMSYCSHCLKDVIPAASNIIECCACGELLHEDCTDCLCERKCPSL
jgi:hypothetical protein